MKLLQDQAYLSRYLLVSMLLILTFYSHAQNNDSVTDEITYQAPENWYQVEVILFTQHRNNRNEAPPKNYQLQFPNDWLQLTDPDELPSLIGPLILEDAPANNIFSEEFASNLFKQQFSISTPLQDSRFVGQNNHLGTPNKPIPEASIPYKYQAQIETDNLDNELPVESSIMENLEQTAELFIPEYEQPFVQLKAPARNLNESAAALDRRAYNVVFHQAWRFQASGPETAPWIIIKAGATDTERYQMEGAIRFYQSRFLHFQANLWRLKFSNTTTKNLPLPLIPKKPLTAQQKVSMAATEFSENLLKLGLPQPTDTSDQNPDLNTQSIDRPEGHSDLLMGELHTEQTMHSIDDHELLDENSATENSYPIDTLWVMNKSQRLQEGDVYYLDHPEMGAFVTIQSYHPEPINLPTAAADIEVEEESEI